MPGPASRPTDGKTTVCNANGKNARHRRNREMRADWNSEMAAFQKGQGRIPAKLTIGGAN